ncbi:MAG: RagB/SusD family nutrient uptake outer membrane protein [Cytophagales bacterium]|nr:RagB/SusD family nutrient uptake outer membrane protein [Cytophagales bacterium]
MKKIIYSLFVVSLFFSCSDFLEEESRGLLAPEAFYQNAEELDLAVTGIYHRIVNTAQSDRVTAATLGGQDLASRFNYFQEYDVFNPTGANKETGAYWAMLYQVITASNDLILNYEKADATEQEKQEAAGQAYFARAYSYFTLVRIWNEIPLYTENKLTYEAEKSSPKEVYDQIIEDLKNAELMLPENWSGVKEHIGFTSGAAKSLLSYVYLSMAGYPVKDESKYALAAEKAKEVIDKKDTYGYDLMSNYADLWKYENNNNHEIVFGLFHNVDYRKSYRAPLGAQPKEYGGWDVYYAEINFYNDFPAGPRKDATFASEFPMEDGSVLDWTETLQAHPYYKKYWEVEGFDWSEPWEYVGWKSGRTNVVLRYANVLLIYAEARAMASSADAPAYDAINQVRNRAGLPDLTEGLSNEAFRDSVVLERSWEFAGGEFAMAPWYDLVRLERVEEAAADRHPSELPIVSMPTKEDYFAPYPESDVLLNPNLDQ